MSTPCVYRYPQKPKGPWPARLAQINLQFYQEKCNAHALGQKTQSEFIFQLHHMIYKHTKVEELTVTS